MEAQLNHVIQYEEMVEVVDSDVEEDVGGGNVDGQDSSLTETMIGMDPAMNVDGGALGG